MLNMIFLLITTFVIAAFQGSAAIDEVCIEDNGYFPDPNQCDAYYNCVDGKATWELCPDGLGFIFFPYYNGRKPRCDFLLAVDCGDRKILQKAKPAPHCKRLWGIYPHEDDCNKFWYCVDGVHYSFQCPPTLAFNEKTGNCDYYRYVDRCSEPAYPIACPRLNELQQLFNPHPLIADPDDCSKFYICMNGKYPRSQGCPPETLFDPITKLCQNETIVDCGASYPQRRSEVEPNINELDDQQIRARSNERVVVENINAEKDRDDGIQRISYEEEEREQDRRGPYEDKANEQDRRGPYEENANEQDQRDSYETTPEVYEPEVTEAPYTREDDQLPGDDIRPTEDVSEVKEPEDSSLISFNFNRRSS